MKAIATSILPGQITIEEKEKPILTKGEVLIEVAYCGICGSDIHAAKHSKGYEFVERGTTLGHEISGTVVKVFDEKDEHLVNKKVIIESMHYCGVCENCQLGRYSICSNIQVIGLHFNGGMTQFVKVKSDFVQEIDARLPIDIAALAEPMSIAVHAVKKINELGTSNTVLVQGTGIIGYFIGLICAHKKADVILSGLENDYAYRLSKAAVFKMKPFIADKEILETKVDYIFECSGSSTALKSGFRYLKKGGKIVVVALYEQETTLFLNDLVRNEWPLITSYGCNPDDYRDASEILIHYKEELRKIISYFPLIEADQAFKESMNQKVLKAVLYK
ncbi:zinc-dependent alcohol dehydrogenase [Peribacillus sp. NPDC076916]|uniref:zinc-dependent alcohol dehydrogenase n=1 Tax=Peribacillus sp. NPDC076916 TaxID=3390608 RepID=UPI003D02A355